MSKQRMAPSYKVRTTGGETLYFCPECLWTFPRDHHHFDFTVQSTLDVGL